MLKKPPPPGDNVLQEMSKDFPEKFDNDNEDTRNWKQKVPKWLHDFDAIFSKTKSERMPERKLYDHHIVLEEGKPLPKPSKVYPLN